MAMTGGVAWGQVKSAMYGNLTIGVDGTTVTGAFYDARPGNGTEDAPQFSCLFLLRGTVEGAANGPTAVTAWTPLGKATTAGTLTIEKETVKLHLDGDPPGCAATGDEFASSPYEDTSVLDGKWTSVRVVSADNAAVRQAPVSGSSAQSRLSKGDVVVVYRRIGAWLEAKNLNARRPVRGWVRESDLEPDQP